MEGVFRQVKNKFSVLVLLATSENIKEAIFDLVKTIIG